MGNHTDLDQTLSCVCYFGSMFVTMLPLARYWSPPRAFSVPLLLCSAVSLSVRLFAMILTFCSPCTRSQPGGRRLDTPGDGAGCFWPARSNAGIVSLCRHPEEGGRVREN